MAINSLTLLATIWITTVNENKLEDPSFKQKWSILFEGLQKDKWSRSTGFIFCARRVVLFVIIFFLIDNGSLQIIAFSLCNCIIFAIIGSFEA